MTECTRCGACCQLYEIVEMSQDDKKRIPKKYWKGIKGINGNPALYSPGCRCRALLTHKVSARCTIHDIRPIACRNWMPGIRRCSIAREIISLRIKNKKERSWEIFGEITRLLWEITFRDHGDEANSEFETFLQVRKQNPNVDKESVGSTAVRGAL